MGIQLRMVKKKLVYKWLRFLMGFEIRHGKPNHLKSGCHFVKKHLKSGEKCPNFEWLCFQMVGVALETGHLKSHLKKVQILNISWFLMVTFQILTVL